MANRVCYSLVTDAGEFFAATFPDIFDSSGAPIPLTAELAAGSVVRISVSATGVMLAVQLLGPRYENPFRATDEGITDADDNIVLAFQVTRQIVANLFATLST